MRSNQGFGSAIATFPQASFATCRYPDTPAMQRTPAENTWHPEFVAANQAPNRWEGAAAGAAASSSPDSAASAAAAAAAAVPKYNTTGTKPLPIPFSQRPGFAEGEAAAARASRAAYEAFQARQLSAIGGDAIPADYHEHTIHSETHIRSQLKPGQTFRPSKPRVGTTPAERAAAAAAMQEQLQQVSGAVEQQEQEQSRRNLMRGGGAAQMQGGSGARFTTVAVDARAGGPTHYNIPERQQPF